MKDVPMLYLARLAGRYRLRVCSTGKIARGSGDGAPALDGGGWSDIADARIAAYDMGVLLREYRVPRRAF